MKNKILATLLAVCMLAGLCVPALAANRSSVECAQDEVHSLALGDWVKGDAVNVKIGDSVLLSDYLVGYNEPMTALRIAPSCNFELVENNVNVRLESSGYLTGISATETPIEVAVTLADKEEVSFRLKVSVSANETTAVATTVVNATGYLASGTDLKITKDGDSYQSISVLKLTSASQFAATNILFTPAQKEFFRLDNENLQVTGSVNRLVNGQTVKVSLAYAMAHLNDFTEAYLQDVETEAGRAAMAVDTTVSLADFAAFVGIGGDFAVTDKLVTLAVDSAPAGAFQIGESVEYSLIAKQFPVIRADGTVGYAAMPAVKGTVKVEAPAAADPNRKLGAVALPNNLSLMVGEIKALNVSNVNIADGYYWGTSYAANAGAAPDFSVIWAEDVDGDGNNQDVQVMGVRVGQNLVMVQAQGVDGAMVSSRTMVTVVPRTAAVEDPSENPGQSGTVDVPQTGGVLLCNLF